MEGMSIPGVSVREWGCGHTIPPKTTSPFLSTDKYIQVEGVKLLFALPPLPCLFSFLLVYNTLIFIGSPALQGL